MVLYINKRQEIFLVTPLPHRVKKNGVHREKELGPKEKMSPNTPVKDGTGFDTLRLVYKNALSFAYLYMRFSIQSNNHFHSF